MPLLFYRYFTRQFVSQLLGILAVICIFVFIFDFLEIMRMFFTKISIAQGIYLAALKNLSVLERLYGLIVMLSSLFAMIKVSRSYELVAFRSIGVNNVQIFGTMMLCSFMFGVLFLALINPLSTKFNTLYDKYEATLLHSHQRNVLLSDVGLWFKQNLGNEVLIMHANKVNVHSSQLEGFSIYYFTDQYEMLQRIDASSATLVDSEWVLDVATVTKPMHKRNVVRNIKIPTSLTFEEIENTMARLKTISFWRILYFIKIAEESGFKVHKYFLYFYQLLLSPLLFALMALLGGSFGQYSGRNTNYYLKIIQCGFVGFLIYFLNDLVGSYGIAGVLDPFLAALIPLVFAGLIAVFCYLHHEYE